MEKNIALIGAGYWGKNHLKNLYKLGALHSVVDADDEILAERARDYPDVNYIRDDGEIMENGDVKGVVIAAPARLHYDLAKRYLLAGKDVLVEKPLALTVREGEDLVGLAEKHDRILMVGHILQYHSAVVALKDMIDRGEVGDIRYIYSNRLNLGKLRVEENVLWSFAPHDISIILMLLGREPVRVTASGASYITSDIYDVTVTNLEFRENVKGHIFVSWLHPYKEQKLVVVGTEKMVLFDDTSTEKLFIYPHRVDCENGGAPVVQKAEYYTQDLDLKEPLREELVHFIDCIESRKAPRTDGNEGLQVLRILERAEKSLKGEID